MIWFACRQCGKKHGRPDNSSGTMVFCECGQGNLVPWESTTTEPEALPATAMPVPPPPRLEPIPIDEQRQTPPPPPSSPPRSLPRETSPREDDSRWEPRRPAEEPRRRQRRRERDPNFCFNHDWLAAAEACVNCKERFCRHCLIQLEDKLLCGPCKNEQIRVQTRPPRTSALAWTAWLVALAAGVVPTCLVPMSASAGSTAFVLLGLAPQVIAFALGVMALRASEADPRLSGRPLAITAMVTAGVGAVLTVGITLYGFVHWV